MAIARRSGRPESLGRSLRTEAKDYIDIHALMTTGRIGLPTALAVARAIYDIQFNPQSTSKALSYFDNGNLRRLPQALKDRLASAARTTDPSELPSLERDGSAG